MKYQPYIERYKKEAYLAQMQAYIDEVLHCRDVPVTREDGLLFMALKLADDLATTGLCHISRV